MVKRKKMIKIITGAVVGSMLLSTSIIAFASQNNASSDNKIKAEWVKGVDWKDCKRGPGMKDRGGKEDLAPILSELVKNGTITQTESDKITAYLKTKQEQRKAEMQKIKDMTEEQRRAYFSEKKDKGKDMLSELVDNGTISKAKADAIRNKMHEKREAQVEQRMKEMESSLNSLVEKGTITKEQANKFINNIKARDKERKALMEKVKNMSPEERRAYFEKSKGDKKSLLKDMVDKGELNQSQADAIRGIMKGSRGKGSE